MFVDDKGELIDLDPEAGIYVTRKRVGDAIVLEYQGMIVILVIDKVSLSHACLRIVAPKSVKLKRARAM